MKVKIPSIVIAGSGSGCGKTTVSCAILAALKKRGISLSAFKCGPDYIDPMFHERAIGISSKNLDGFFCEDSLLKCLYYNGAKKSELAIIEGVMGFYDGLAMDSTRASTYETAKAVKAPVVLVINAKGMALTAVSVIKGITQFRADSNISAVILNGVTKSVYIQLKTVIESALPLKVIGYMPYCADCSLESRHLGLVTPQNITNITERLDKLANLAEECIDLNALVAMANQAGELDTNPKSKEIKTYKVKIAVARDNAFCFYYRDNLDMLERLGCEITYFSPINDSGLPKDVDGIVLGGGYPELYCKELSSNKKMLADIKTALEDGMPCLAECGGFMYLHKTIEDKQKNKWKMAGLINATAVYAAKLVRFGYITITDKYGNEIKAHEFHYWDSTENGTEYTAVKPSGKKWQCMHRYKNTVCGFPHIFYYSNPYFAEEFVKNCALYKGDGLC